MSLLTTILNALRRFWSGELPQVMPKEIPPPPTPKERYTTQLLSAWDTTNTNMIQANPQSFTLVYDGKNQLMITPNEKTLNDIANDHYKKAEQSIATYQATLTYQDTIYNQILNPKKEETLQIDNNEFYNKMNMSNMNQALQMKTTPEEKAEVEAQQKLDKFQQEAEQLMKIRAKKNKKKPTTARNINWQSEDMKKDEPK